MFWKKKNESDKVLVMKRKNSDNEYLHKDFHLSMNLLLDYLYDNFGEEGVKDYLKRFTHSYHSPVSRELSFGSLMPLIDYFEEIYGVEGSKIEMDFSQNHLTLTLASCPAVDYIKKMGKVPSRMHKFTYETVFQTICEGSEFEYILDRYNEETGGGIHIFMKKEDEA